MRARYDHEFWNSYADTNEERYDREFAERLVYTASALGCASVLEVGCGTAVDMRLLPDTVSIYGVDPNYRALAIARSKMPHACFLRGMIAEMPFVDSSVDLVFTHGLLNYLDDQTLERGMHEMYRVARKHIMSCEWFGESESPVDQRSRLRNMVRRWTGLGAAVMADAPIHVRDAAVRPSETFPATRITLISKIS